MLNDTIGLGPTYNVVAKETAVRGLIDYVLRIMNVMIDNGEVDLNETTDKDHSLLITIGCHNTLNSVIIMA